jgi:hypothetical protein
MATGAAEMQRVTRASDTVDEIMQANGPIDWTDPKQAIDVIAHVFDDVVSSPGLLRSLVIDLRATGGALGACESFPCLDKLVLWQSHDHAVRLRLHLFSPGYLDRPHNHRWSFASRLLTGGYLHTVYGSESDVLDQVSRGAEPRPLYVQPEHTGTQYFLDHQAVHSLRTDETSVSLMLRGPAAKSEYFTVEPGPGPNGVAGNIVWSTGIALETSSTRRAKSMTETDLSHTVDTLDRLGVV